MNKKHICLFLAIFFLILNTIPYIGVFADNDIVIYDPDANTDLTEQLNYDPTDLGVLNIIYGILKNGSSIDFSNTSFSTSNNPWSDFTSNLIGSVTGIDPVLWDDATDYSLETLALGLILPNALFNLDDTYSKTLANLGVEYLAGLAQYANLGLEDEQDIITPSPDPNFAQYLDIINGSGFFFKDYPNMPVYSNHELWGSTQLYFPNYNYSWYSNSDIRNIKTMVDNGGNGGSFACSDIYDINIISIGNDNYQMAITPTLKSNCFYSSYWGPSLVASAAMIGRQPFYNINGQEYMDYGIQTANGINAVNPNYSGSGSLLGLFTNVLIKYYRNVNIYVDGVPWSIVGTPTQYNISIGGNTYINNIPSPIEYIVPSSSYLDLNNLKQKIIDAILGSGVLLWEDIADCIVDVNGNQVITTYNVIRNDYDVLYREQYPETLIPDNGNYFNKNLLVNYRNELKTPVLVVENTLDVLPSDLKTCLYICGILAIFALVINRLLE